MSSPEIVQTKSKIFAEKHGNYRRLSVEQLARFENPREQELLAHYYACYDRIYPLLLETTVDFKKIAGFTKFPERKVREVLLFRLICGDAIQLIGYQSDICFLCQAKMGRNRLEEPLCLTCLKQLDQVIQEIYAPPKEKATEIEAPAPLSLLEARKKAEVATLAEDSAQMPALAPEEPAETEETVRYIEISLPVYQELQRELQGYRERYGPLPVPVGDLDHPVGENASSDGALLAPHPGKELRHFGFQRVRSRNERP